MIPLALTWRGTTSLLGWGGVAPSLNPKLRGSLAYVFGRRLLRLKQPTEARELLRQAAAEAPTESSLRRLAEAQLRALGEP